MSLLKSVPLLYVSCAWISTDRCDAFVRLDPITAIHMADNHDSRQANFLDDRIRLRGVESLHYRTFDDQLEAHAIPNTQITQSKQVASSIRVPSNHAITARHGKGKKSEELDMYLDSINRRYKRLYGETGDRPAYGTTSSSGHTGLFWDWLLKSDSSKAVDQERRQQDALYVLQHTALTSELYLNKPRNREPNIDIVPKNTMRACYDVSASTEALIAGGFDILKTEEMINNPIQRIVDIRKMFRFSHNVLYSMIADLRRKITQFHEKSSRKFISKISNSILPLVPMILITYVLLFSTR
jgi:hypothetical protein